MAMTPGTSRVVRLPLHQRIDVDERPEAMDDAIRAADSGHAATVEAT
jgi:hypothetical protein